MKKKTRGQQQKMLNYKLIQDVDWQKALNYLNFSLSSYYDLVHSAYIAISHCSVPNQQLKFDVDKKHTQLDLY